MDIAETAYRALVTEYDIVVLTPSTPLRRAGTTLAQTLAREPLDIALPPSHHLAASATLTAADVVNEDWIASPEGYPFNAILASIEAATGQAIHVTQRILDNHVTEALVASGRGIAVLPRFTTHTDRVALRPLVGIPAVRYITAVAGYDRAQRRAVAHSLESLIAIARTLNEPDTAHPGISSNTGTSKATKINLHS